ncbi:MAG: outer membrane lipoprotein carrier protein LolA [Acidobacteriota bacterium]|nr:outer membrane lipoprotein carrier protein LolA [Acidobacteriota bacterium]
MKKVITLALVTGMFLALAGITRVPYVAANTTPQILTGILNKMENAHQQMKSLKAELIQQKTNPQIGSTDTDYGVVLYKPAFGKDKGKLRIDYTRPSKDIVSVVGENVTFYQPRINQVFKGTVNKLSKGKAGVSLVGIDGSLKNLTASYNIEFVKDEAVNSQMTTLLRLTPKGGGQYSAIDLWVNQQNWLPAQWKMSERNGDFTVITLKNLQLNNGVTDAAFVVTIPNGTKVVDKF